jgi:hypothetical protein
VCGGATCKSCFEEEEGCFRCGYNERRDKVIPTNETCEKCGSRKVYQRGGPIFELVFGFNIYECQTCHSAWFYATEEQARGLVRMVVYGGYNFKIINTNRMPNLLKNTTFIKT